MVSRAVVVFAVVLVASTGLTFAASVDVQKRELELPSEVAMDKRDSKTCYGSGNKVVPCGPPSAKHVEALEKIVETGVFKDIDCLTYDPDSWSHNLFGLVLDKSQVPNRPCTETGDSFGEAVLKQRLKKILGINEGLSKATIQKLLLETAKEARKEYEDSKRGGAEPLE